VATTPPAKKLAKVDLKRRAVASPYAPDPAPGAEPAETPPQLHPVFARNWDPLEAPPAVFFESPVPEPEAGGTVIDASPEPEVECVEPGVVEMHESEAQQAHEPVLPPPAADDQLPALRAEIQERREEILVLESRVESLSRLGARISALEERLKEQAAPASGSSLSRKVKLLLDERCFAEAERALQGAEVQGDPLLLVRLGQALLGQSDPDGTRTARAEEAFWRAADLDPRWALPKALLGTLLLRRGKRRPGRALLRSALALDPGCAEAQAAAGDHLRRTAVLSSAAGGAAIGAMALALVVSFASRTPTAAPASVPVPMNVRVAAPVTVAAPAPSVPVLEKERPAETAARAEPKPVPEKPRAVLKDPPRPRKPMGTAAAGDRAAAVEAAARGDKAIRSFNTKEALAAFEGALKLDPTLPGAHRGMGMVYVLQGKNAEAKAEYQKYLQAAPDAPDAEQIRRLLAR
jgi:tetratricopeptide (TPR) repeat protein